MNILLISAPGAGKGSLSNILKEKNGYVSISAGEVLRQEIASGSDLGLELKKVVDSGLLVDDEKLKELMIRRFEKLGNQNNIIMDGYPRTIKQIDDFLDIFEMFDKKLNYVFWLDVDKEITLRRAMGRLNCPKCGKDYNIYNEKLMPKKEGVCDICNEHLTKRNDDNKESYERRYDTYLKETEPLINVFKEKGLLIKVDASTTTENVHEQVMKYLGE